MATVSSIPTQRHEVLCSAGDSLTNQVSELTARPRMSCDPPPTEEIRLPVTGSTRGTPSQRAHEAHPHREHTRHTLTGSTRGTPSQRAHKAHPHREHTLTGSTRGTPSHWQWVLDLTVCTCVGERLIHGVGVASQRVWPVSGCGLRRCLECHNTAGSKVDRAQLETLTTSHTSYMWHTLTGSTRGTPSQGAHEAHPHREHTRHTLTESTPSQGAHEAHLHTGSGCWI